MRWKIASVEKCVKSSDTFKVFEYFLDSLNNVFVFHLNHVKCFGNFKSKCEYFQIFNKNQYLFVRCKFKVK